MPKEKIGVILVNLGTPTSSDVRSVSRYLREFLSDPRVVEIPRLFWWCILNFFVIPLRAYKVSENYRSIWLKEGSPLKVITQRQVKALQSVLNESTEREFIATYAMTYGDSSIVDSVKSLQDRRVNKIIVLPLFPQYSSSTTAAVYDQLAELVKNYRHIPDIRVVHHYYNHSIYIEALANTIHRHWKINGQAECLLMSFHGIPKNYVNKGDPYYSHCRQTARLLASRLDLSDQQWAFSFQSRFGRQEWVKPYTDVVLKEWGSRGLESVDVICPAFASDCLETLEEIDQKNRELFLDSGGGRFSMIPCLNDSPSHIEMLRTLVSQYC